MAATPSDEHVPSDRAGDRAGDLAGEKAALRKSVLARRAAVAAVPDAADQASAAAQRVTALLADVAGPEAKQAPVAAYLEHRSELATGPLIEALARAGCAVCLPVVTAPETPLTFRRWAPGDDLMAGAFGIREPAAGPAVRPGVLIVPLVAFDGERFRLGYGGGFYDRTLELFSGDGGARPLAIGYAFDAQEVAAVPRGAHDRQLDAVVTPSRVIR